MTFIVAARSHDFDDIIHRVLLFQSNYSYLALIHLIFKCRHVKEWKLQLLVENIFDKLEKKTH